jgi:hypothetical protein
MPRSSILTNATPGWTQSQCNSLVSGKCIAFKNEHPEEFQKRWGTLGKCYEYTTPVACRKQMDMPQYQLDSYCKITTDLTTRLYNGSTPGGPCVDNPNTFGNPVDRSMIKCSRASTLAEYGACYIPDRKISQQLETWSK